MIRSLIARRLVAGVSITLLLLCQTAAAALSYVTYAPMPATPQTAATPTQADAPCHQAASDDSTPAHGCQDRCHARDASLQTVKVDKVHIPAADALVLPLCAVLTPDAGTATSVPHLPLAANATSPPLRLVYCRLLM